MAETVKDRRINIRIDEETYEALQNYVKEELHTDISAFCRSLLSTVVMSDTVVSKAKKATKEMRQGNSSSLDYMIGVHKNIRAMGALEEHLEEGQAEIQSLRDLITKGNRKIKEEAKKFFAIYNSLVDDLGEEFRNYYDDYDNKPSAAGSWDRVEID